MIKKGEKPVADRCQGQGVNNVWSVAKPSYYNRSEHWGQSETGPPFWSWPQISERS